MAGDSLAATKHRDLPFYVYVHKRVRTGEIFYVGKGHGRRAHTASGRNARWRDVVANDGGREVGFLVIDVDEEFAFLVEIEAIDKYRRAGCCLVNRTNGGEGPSGMRHSEETKQKFRSRRFSEETRRKMSTAQKAFGKRSISESAKAAALAWHQANPGTFKGKKHSPEARAKMAAAWDARRLRPISNETRMKMSSALKGRTASIETRAKMSASRTGLKSTPESIAKRLRTLAENKARKDSTNGR